MKHKNLFPIALGFLLLFTASFLDNARGPILPILRDQLSLSGLELSGFLVLGHGAAVLSSLTMQRLLNRTQESTITFGVIVLACVSCVLAFVQPSRPWFYAMAFIMGTCITCFGTLSNVYIMGAAKTERAGQIMSALHSMYGLGSWAASLTLGILFSVGLQWPFAFIGVAALLIVLGIANYHGHVHHHASKTIEIQSTRLRAIHYLLMALFCLYVAGEVGISMWMSAFLVKVRGMSLAAASFQLSLFFLLMSLSRLACFWLAVPQWQRRLLVSSIVIALVALVTAHAGFHDGFWLAGVLGPFFPILMARIKSSFASQWRAVTIWVIFSTQLVLALMHLSVGGIADTLGLETAYQLPCIFLAALIPCLLYYLRLEKRVCFS